MLEIDLLQSYFTSSLLSFRQFAGRFGDQGSKSSVSAKYCYAAHESRLHQNDRCKRFTLCLVLTVRFRSLAPWGSKRKIVSTCSKSSNVR